MASWKQRDIFPLIRETIESLCTQNGKAEHYEIIRELLLKPEACAVIDSALRQRPDSNQHAIAAEMIAWFSQKHTMESDDFSQRFIKERVGHKAYSYFPAKLSDQR
jgi:hypothetical protein